MRAPAATPCLGGMRPAPTPLPAVFCLQGQLYLPAYCRRGAVQGPTAIAAFADSCISPVPQMWCDTRASCTSQKMPPPPSRSSCPAAGWPSHETAACRCDFLGAEGGLGCVQSGSVHIVHIGAAVWVVHIGAAVWGHGSGSGAAEEGRREASEEGLICEGATWAGARWVRQLGPSRPAAGRLPTHRLPSPHLMDAWKLLHLHKYGSSAACTPSRAGQGV